MLFWTETDNIDGEMNSRIKRDPGDAKKEYAVTGGLHERVRQEKERKCAMDERSLQVYIVDDESSVVEWLVENVEWDVYNCQIAGCSTDAATALQYMEVHPVDLLLTDICMPELSGLELIRLAKERFPDLFIIVISAYDKFEYVKEALQYGIINYCLKPIDTEELDACLKTAEAAFRERMLYYRNTDNVIFQNSIYQRLLNGEDSTFRLLEQCRLAGIVLDVPVCQVALIDTKQLEKAKYMSVINRLSGEEWRELHCFLDGHMNLVLLFLGERGCDKETEKRLKEVLRQEGILFRSFLCIGKKLKSYRQIAEEYRICFDFLNAGFLFPNNGVRTERYPYERYLHPIKNKELQRLMNGLKAGSPDTVLQAIEKIADNCPTEEKRKADLICVTVFLIKHMGGIHPYRNLAIPGGYLESLLSSAKMLEWIEEFYKEIVHFHGDDSEFLHPYVNRALQEINNNYKDNTLCLQEVARSCMVSSAYLGKIFKAQTGEIFNDYLMKVRLKAAETLLYENKLRIGEIAVRVGFAHQSYFNRMFRREYGISPAEYRRRCHEEAEN